MPLLFGDKLPYEVQCLIMEFDPTAKERMDEVLHTLVTTFDPTSYYVYEINMNNITNYPRGAWECEEIFEGIEQVTRWTYPYFSVALQRMVPEHEATRINHGPVVIAHFIPGRGRVPGRFMEGVEILMP
jgi:hypothetical protein